MANYLVTYDLNKAGQNYSDLYNALKSYPKWAHPMDSVWFLKTTKSPKSIAEHLHSCMDSNDELFVCKITADNFGWLDDKFWKFLNS